MLAALSQSGSSVRRANASMLPQAKEALRKQTSLKETLPTS